MNNRRWVWWILLLWCPFSGHAAFERLVTGGRHAGVAGASAALAGDPWGMFANPAGILGLPGCTIVTSVCPSIYGIPELRHLAVSAILPLSWGSIGVAGTTLGVDGYRETTASLVIASPLGPAFGCGIRMNSLWLGITSYGSTVVPTFDAGLQARITESFSVGFLLENVTGARLGIQKEALPRSVEFGLSIVSSDLGVQAHASAVKELSGPLDWRMGVSFTPYECLTLRTGISTEPALLCGGLGLTVAPVTLDYAVSHHWQLGLTHHVSLGFSIE